jgi:hypothetical protein
MENKKLNWRDLLRQHMQSDIQSTVAHDTELRVIMLPEYNPEAELAQIREFMMEFDTGTVRHTAVSNQGFKLPGNGTVH